MTPRLLRFLRRSGFYKGVLGDSRGWLAVFVGLYAARRVAKIWTRSPEVVSIEQLVPGQTVAITALMPEKKSRRKR